MAYGRSSYPTGGSRTEIGGEPIDSSPTAMLQALLRKEADAPRRVEAAPAAPRKRMSGTFTPSAAPTAMDGARALMRPAAAPEGRHSFVTNIKGGPQVYGGLVSSGSGASPGNTFYGGWQVDEAPGPVRFANLPGQDGPVFEPGEDPAVRAAALNELAGSGRRAVFMPGLGGRR